MIEKLIKDLYSNRSDFGQLAVDKEFIEKLRSDTPTDTTIYNYLDSLDLRDLPVLRAYATTANQVLLSNTIHMLIEKTGATTLSHHDNTKIAICYITTCTKEEKFLKRQSMLKESILSLKKLAHTNFDIHIFVNGYTSTKPYDLEVPNIKYNIHKSNKGLAFGRNALIEDVINTGAEFLIFLDDDTYINDPYLINKLLHVAKNKKDVGMVGPEIVYKNKKVLDSGLNFVPESVEDKYEDTYYKEVDFIEGSCTLFECEMLREFYGMNKEIYPNHYNYYWEEVLFAWKLWFLYHKKNVVVKGARIVHIREGGGFTNLHSYYHFVRNFLYLATDIWLLSSPDTRQVLVKNSASYLKTLYKIAKDRHSIKHRLVYSVALIKGASYILKTTVNITILHLYKQCRSNHR